MTEKDDLSGCKQEKSIPTWIIDEGILFIKWQTQISTSPQWYLGMRIWINTSQPWKMSIFVSDYPVLLWGLGIISLIWNTIKSIKTRNFILHIFTFCIYSIVLPVKRTPIQVENWGFILYNFLIIARTCVICLCKLTQVILDKSSINT